ncbi:MAG: hypothetical protein ACTSV7_00090 [Candidatus Baldrarchaeia archaeon]
MRGRQVWRQGDIVFVREKEVADATPDPTAVNAPTRVEFGSETGNPHVVEDVQVIYQSRWTQEVIFQTDKPVEVKHPQHATLVLPSGTYRAYPVRDATRGIGARPRLD